MFRRSLCCCAAQRRFAGAVVAGAAAAAEARVKLFFHSVSPSATTLTTRCSYSSLTGGQISSVIRSSSFVHASCSLYSPSRGISDFTSVRKEEVQQGNKEKGVREVLWPGSRSGKARQNEEEESKRSFESAVSSSSREASAVNKRETGESMDVDTNDIDHEDDVPFKSPEQLEIEQSLHSLKENYLKLYDTTFHYVSDATYTAPMVMMLGNHSSGKSTLINYLIGREVQETGVAPTDDGFTVIQRGSFDMTDDGPTAVMNPRYQFESLQSFGYSFVNRFKVKTRVMPKTSKLPRGMMLVDTPGMIDTPVHVADRTTTEGQLRGYDFLATTRWFAQRSDVVLLMFDPSNPGTTGETLDVLTKSLAGLEHKFLLVMNKADMFEKVTDYARAYGSLCWNLSKVIKMKDIPRIYTTCTPRANVATRQTVVPVVSEEEIVRQRSEILEEILSAPLRRLDNLVTETEESAKCLYLTSQVCSALRRQYKNRELTLLLGIGTGSVAAPLLIMALSSVSMTATVLTTLLSALLGCGALLGSRAHLYRFEADLLATCDSVVGRLYPGKEMTKDTELRWKNVVKPEIYRFVQSRQVEGKKGIASLPTLSQRAMRRVQRVITAELPMLRTKVSMCKEQECRRLRAQDKNGSGY